MHGHMSPGTIFCATLGLATFCKFLNQFQKHDTVLSRKHDTVLSEKSMLQSMSCLKVLENGVTSGHL